MASREIREAPIRLVAFGRRLADASGILGNALTRRGAAAGFLGIVLAVSSALAAEDQVGANPPPGAGGASAAATGAPAIGAPAIGTATGGATAGAPAVDGLAIVAAIEGALQNAIASAEKSVVAIARVKRGEVKETPFDQHVDRFGRLLQPTAPKPGDPDFIPNEFGAGVVIDRDGLVLTHYHVLGDPSRGDIGESQFYVTTPARRTYRAEVKSADPRSDLAVLRIDAHDLTPIRIGDGGAVKKGQIVIALGNPYAIARDGQASASWGIVSNLSRKSPPARSPHSSLQPPSATLHQYGALIQTDAKLNLGTSGGALINLKGEMVGLLTATAAVAGYEQAAGYAVPTDETFRRVIETLKQGHEAEYGMLGIQPVNLPQEARLAGKHGALIHEVEHDTPAERAMLQKASVITHVNGEPVYDSDGLVLSVGRQTPDAVVALTVRSGDRAETVNVALTKYPVVGKIVATAAPPSWRGLTVDYGVVRYDLRIDFRHDLLVKAVAPDSPAWSAGVRPDMHIKSVGNVAVASPKSFYALVSEKSGPVTLTVNTGISDRRIVVPPGE